MSDEKKEIEQNIEEIEDMLEQNMKQNSNNEGNDEKETGILSKIIALPQKLLDRVWVSNGFITKKNGWYSKSEGHALGIGASMIGLGYILPTPLGEFSILAFLLMVRTGFNKIMKNEEITGHLGDVMHDMAYTLVAAFATAIIMDQYTGYSLSEVDVGKMMAQILLGG